MASIVQEKAHWTNGPGFVWALGVCPKRCYNHFAHFPSFWYDLWCWMGHKILTIQLTFPSIVKSSFQQYYQYMIKRDNLECWLAVNLRSYIFIKTEKNKYTFCDKNSQICHIFWITYNQHGIHVVHSIPCNIPLL